MSKKFVYLRSVERRVEFASWACVESSLSQMVIRDYLADSLSDRSRTEAEPADSASVYVHGKTCNLNWC